MTYRLERSVNGHTVTFTVSGTVNATRAAHLQSLVDREGGATVVLDLQDVTLVERDAVALLAGLGRRGAEFVNCPGYLRLWMEAARHPEIED